MSSLGLQTALSASTAVLFPSGFRNKVRYRGRDKVRTKFSDRNVVPELTKYV